MKFSRKRTKVVNLRDWTLLVDWDCDREFEKFRKGVGSERSREYVRQRFSQEWSSFLDNGHGNEIHPTGGLVPTHRYEFEYFIGSTRKKLKFLVRSTKVS
uniref:Uncharacterized protein n=1 Tax=Cacopsylla melanoneura TaxID=428564 RepID=A0A8D8LT82_9HEMI